MKKTNAVDLPVRNYCTVRCGVKTLRPVNNPAQLNGQHYAAWWRNRG